jgi:hypothetical protein
METWRALNTHPKAVCPMEKSEIILCVGLGCQVKCKVKIDFIEVPTYYNKPKKSK